eukprot:197929-Hanusia_phi.AAC.5
MQKLWAPNRPPSIFSSMASSNPGLQRLANVTSRMLLSSPPPPPLLFVPLVRSAGPYLPA